MKNEPNAGGQAPVRDSGEWAGSELPEHTRMAVDHRRVDQLEALEARMAGQRVQTSRIFARARVTGMPLYGEFGHVWTVRDGRATAVEAHRDHEEARRAAGVA